MHTACAARDSVLEPPTFGGFQRKGALPLTELDFLLRLTQLVLTALRVSDWLKRRKKRADA